MSMSEKNVALVCTVPVKSQPRTPLCSRLCWTNQQNEPHLPGTCCSSVLPKTPTTAHSNGTITSLMLRCAKFKKLNQPTVLKFSFPHRCVLKKVTSFLIVVIHSLPSYIQLASARSSRILYHLICNEQSM